MKTVSQLKLTILALLLLTSIGFIGCGQTQVERESPSRTPHNTAALFSVEEYPKVDGSTSTLPLEQYIVGALYNLELARILWPYSSFGDMPTSTAVMPLAPEPQEEPYSEEVLNVFRRIRHTGTNTAYMRLIRGDEEPSSKPVSGGPPITHRVASTPSLPREGADLILEARPPSEDELALAKEKGVELDVRPVALDAFVFIVNKENPVENLTTKQIQDIYTGKITDWSQVGGDAEKIKPYQRERNSGSQELMKSLVMKDLPIIDAPEMIVMTMIGPFSALSREKYGLGYSVFYYEEYMADRSKTKLCAVDGVMPNPDTILSRQYPYVAEVYVVTRADLPENSPAYRLREWLLSDEGQRAVAASGYVPIRKVK